jgi:hypothetical protein
MNDDPRCCGSGTCIIDREGRCWCGQRWEGDRMCQPGMSSPAATTTPQTKDGDG